MKRLSWLVGLAALALSIPSTAQLARGTTYNSPFAYCAAVGTIDQPGAPYRGPESPADIERVVGGPATFRCDSGQVLGCALGATGRACFKKDVSRAPSAELMAFCRARPNAPIDYATQGYSAYEWRCRGRTPQIVSGPSVDATGYMRDAWQVIPNRAAPRASAAVAVNTALLGRWEQDATSCGDPPDYALTITRTMFTSFAHACRFTQTNILASAIKGRMACDYSGEGVAPKGGFNMTIELTGKRTLKFGETGKELVTYHKCG